MRQFGAVIVQICAALAVLGAVAALPFGDESNGRKIVNGTDASIEDFPFMISLRGSSGGHSCGGSILSRYWILTAAHCVSQNTPLTHTIQAGRTDISRDVDDSVYPIADVVIHPGYDETNSYIDDIALLRLARPLTFSDSVRPVRLPKRFFEIDPAHPDVKLIGWGRLYSDGPLPTTLQQIDYYAVPNEVCSGYHSNHIYPMQICAAEPDGGKGQCSGDSGGPLLYDGVQVGIVSWSVKPCAVAPYPGVLTKVSHYVDFISMHTSSFEENGQ